MIKEALNNLAEMYRREFNGPPIEELHEAANSAWYGLQGIDRKSSAWAAAAVEYSDEQALEDLRTMLQWLDGPLMEGAPAHIMAVVVEARAALPRPDFEPEDNGPSGP